MLPGGEEETLPFARLRKLGWDIDAPLRSFRPSIFDGFENWRPAHEVFTALYCPYFK
jgi:hypothetical protein